jgi:hypothetical protein
MTGVFNPAEMRMIPNPGCLHYFKSRAPDTFKTDLFVYQHMRTKKFLLARWFADTVFDVILELADDLQLNDDIVTQYRNFCHPQSAPSLVKGLKEARNNHLQAEDDYEYEKRSIRAKLMRDEFGIKMPEDDGCVYLPPAIFGS